MKLALLWLANSSLGQDIFLGEHDASRDGEVHTPLTEAEGSFPEPIDISGLQTNLSSARDPCDYKTWKYDPTRQATAKKRRSSALPANYDPDAFLSELNNLIIAKYQDDLRTALNDFTLQLSTRKPTKGADSGLTTAIVSWLLTLVPDGVKPIVDFINFSKATAKAVKAMLEEPGNGLQGYKTSSYRDYAIKINDNLARSVSNMKLHANDARNAFAKELRDHSADKKQVFAIRLRHYAAVTELLNRQQSLRQLRNVMFGSFLKSAGTVFKRWVEGGGGVPGRCPDASMDSYNLCTNRAVDDEAALLKRLVGWNPTCFNGLGLTEKTGSWYWVWTGQCTIRKSEQSSSKLRITQGYPTKYLRKCDDF